MLRGHNPVLPSWLLWDRDIMNNTILHYAAETTNESAAETTNKGEGFALQMQREMEWFETVKKLVPNYFVSSRNGEEMTAQELFNEKHAEMLKDGRNQLMELGKTCSGLLAAVVFATSFNIPGVKDSDSSTGPSNNNNMTKSTHERNHFNDESVGFKVFTHAYVIGLSFATCSLVLFLSLLTSNYRPEAFRKSLPTKYILAGVSFFFALLALLVAFTCNVYLSIYGAGTPKAKDLLPLVLELTAFPFLCAVALFLGGFGVRFSDFILRILHR
ncbi:putative PGG domain-containing protein [Dioscorea sansibarensis]